MFRKTNLIAATYLVVALLPGGLAQSAPDGPLGVVRGLFEVMNAGDLEGTRARFTDNGYASYGEDGEPYAGAGLDAWLESDIIGPGARFELAGACVADGAVVASGRWGTGGVLSGPFLYRFGVEGGRVESWVILDPSTDDNPCPER